MATALLDKGDDRFEGPAVPTVLSRTYGGQVAAQALAAAFRTVRTSLLVHSLHAYFLREADPGTPIELTVDRTRDGGSFCTRQVTAAQDGRAVFVMLASFHAGDPGPEHTQVVPATAAAEELPDVEPWKGFGDEWPDWDVRRVPDHGPRSQCFWLRHREPLADDPVLHAVGLAYLSDLTLLGVAAKDHDGPRLQMASLDHSLWFLDQVRVDQWLRYDQTAPSTGGGRTLTEGRLYDSAGRLVASVVQQGLMRFLR